MKKLLLLLLALPVLLVAQPKAGYYDAAVGKTDVALNALNRHIKGPMSLGAWMDSGLLMERPT